MTRRRWNIREDSNKRRLKNEVDEHNKTEDRVEANTH
jgi:hypothetical protein